MSQNDDAQNRLGVCEYRLSCARRLFSERLGNSSVIYPLGLRIVFASLFVEFGQQGEAHDACSPVVDKLRGQD